MLEEVECASGLLPLLVPKGCALRLLLAGEATPEDPLRLLLELVGVDSAGDRPPPGSGIVIYTKTLGVAPSLLELIDRSGIQIPVKPEEDPVPT